MRIACSALLIAGATLFAGSSGAIAAPASGGAIKAAAEEIGVTESVHCRPFRHAHPRWHRFGHGCRGAGLMIYERGPRFRHRCGVREEFRGGFRTRERAGVTIRGGEGFRGETTFRSGTREGTSVRGSTTIRSGGAGDVSPRGSMSGGQAQQGGGAATTGRQMNTQPSGQTTGGQQRGSGQSGSQRGSGEGQQKQ